MAARPLNRFLLRLVLFTPLCLGLWWLTFSAQIEGLIVLFRDVLGPLHPRFAVSAASELKGLILTEQDSEVPLLRLDPFALSRGLPIYAALMLASEGPRFGRLILGATGLSFAVIFGLMTEAHLRLLVLEGSQAVWLNPASFQLGLKLLVTKSLPVGLWIIQCFPFVRRLVRPLP